MAAVKMGCISKSSAYIALRRRLEQARSNADRAANSAEQSIRDRYENARKD